jgi:non-canonical purine NTP pyrophosphatase (RdgB/HAM1 family)
VKKLVFVTQNQNKVNDAKKLMHNFDLEHVDFDVPEIQSLDTREIASYKIKYAYEKVQKPCFVMDASLFFDCLNGFPGPFIKWFFKYTVGAQKTCDIANFFNQHGCRWTTVLAYFDGQKTFFFEETIRGSIASTPRGTNGYEWDVIFVPEGETRTFAEMTFEEKQQYAVTKKLLHAFAQFLETN